VTWQELIAGLQSASLYLQDLNLEQEVDAVSFAEEWLKATANMASPYLEMQQVRKTSRGLRR
jgi:hypothetical protein